MTRQATTANSHRHGDPEAPRVAATIDGDGTTAARAASDPPPDSGNPFVGLRPFEESEAHLFFGRDGQSDELVRRLGRRRFLAVVGVSGSGKSSLLRAGLFAGLRGGFMASAGSNWRIVLLRPGSAPIGALAGSLHRAFAGAAGDPAAALSEAIIESTLRRGSLGLIDAARQGRIGAAESLLVVVDQFEELFRYRAIARDEARERDAAAFVKLLLEAAQQTTLSLYVILAMRSDFLGECAQFRGLPEAMNENQYLIPRMNRDERRQAIVGPVGVGGGRISQRLVQRLLNDVGEDPDQLPVLQHALMRTWQHWEGHRRDGSPIDFDDYEAIGTIAGALSRHADQAFEGLGAGQPRADAEAQRRIAERLFRRLTERGADGRETRRPTRFDELCAVAEAPPSRVGRVVEQFRQPACSFLMPPHGIPLRDDTVIDISHESLIRKWRRLDAWVADESQSRVTYLRLADAASRHADGTGGLWRNPDLALALAWLRRARPNAAWAARYGGGYARTLDFLSASRKRARVVRGAAAAALAGVVVLGAWVAITGVEVAAQRQRQVAVFEALKAYTYDLADQLERVPGTGRLLVDLYDRNIGNIDAVSRLVGETQASARERAVNLLRKGDQLLQLGDAAAAEAAFRQAGPLLERVAASGHGNPEFRRDLANYHQRMGNARLAQGDAAGALADYRTSLAIVDELLASAPDNPRLRRDAALGHAKLADALLARGDAAAAAGEYVAGIARAEALASGTAVGRELAVDLAEFHDGAARAYAKAGRRDDAALHQRAAREIRDRIDPK